jgi:tetrahydromethanopterin S-methyltransferase subunit G
VATLLSNPTAISNLAVSSVNINGQSSTAARSAVETATSGGGSNSETAVWTNTGLIIGLVVGLVVATLMVVSVILGYRAHKRKTARGRCMVEAGKDLPLSVLNQNDPASPRPSVDITEGMKDVNETLVEEFMSPSLDQLDSESSQNFGRRIGSAFSLDRIGSANTTTPRSNNPGLHTLKLIDFD